MVIAPPLIYHYIYPNLGSDSATHLITMLSIQNGNNINQLYLGHWLLSYFLKIGSGIFHISQLNLWMWFNCLILIPIGLVLYLITSKLFGWKIGLISLIVPIFISGGIMEMYYWGVIYDVINLVIFVPILFYFLAKWLTENKVYQAIIVLLMTVLVSTFHTSGLYLPFVLIFALAVYVVYKIVKKQANRDLYRPIIAGISLFVISIISMKILSPNTISQITYYISPPSGIKTLGSVYVTNAPYLRNLYISFVPYIISFITIPILGIFIVSSGLLRNRGSSISNQSKIMILLFSCLVIELLVAFLMKVTTDRTRIQEDLAISFSLLTFFLLCITLKVNKSTAWSSVLGILIVFGLISGLNIWRQNNSAVKEVDKQAIGYLNTLEESTFYCSSAVDKDIYGLYIKEKYDANSDLFITRNIDLTNISSKVSPQSNDYKLLKQFTDGKVVVDIYER